MAQACLPIEQSVSQQREREASGAMELQEVHILPPQQPALANLKLPQIPRRLPGPRDVTSPAAEHWHTQAVRKVPLSRTNTQYMTQLLNRKILT